MTFAKFRLDDIIEDKTGVLVLKHSGTSPTVGVNRTIQAGVAGKRLRVLGGILSTGAVAATIQFKSASAGTMITAPIDIPASVNPVILDLRELGWFETLVNADGIFADVTGATVNVSLRYVEVTYS